jgi:hypothetical protein
MDVSNFPFAFFPLFYCHHRGTNTDVSSSQAMVKDDFESRICNISLGRVRVLRCAL